MNRTQRKETAQKTLDISKKRKYRVKGKEIALYGEKGCKPSELLKEEDVKKVKESVQKSDSKYDKKPYVEVTKDSVVDAMIKYGGDKKRYGKVGVLNFASARNPGGGFLGGSLAQEEAIAISSDLYLRIKDFDEFYKYKKHYESGLYSDRMIYTEDLAIFRDANYSLLEKIINVDVITSPAVNANAVKTNNKELYNKVNPTMESRIENIIALAKYKGIDTLVLGAYGTGVFGNNVYKVKDMFVKVLNKGEYRTAFKHVVFAIYDPKNETTYNVFKGIRIK